MRRGITLLEVLVVLGIAAVLLALVMPAVQRAREAAGLIESQNKIKQMLLALQNLASGSPDSSLPGIVASAPPFRSDTFCEMLPYLGEEALYRWLFDASPLDVENTQVRAFLNPLDPSAGHRNPAAFGSNPSQRGVSSYALNAQFFEWYPRLNRISDGLAGTIWVTEHYGWNCGKTSFLWPVNYARGAGGTWSPEQPATFAQAGPAVGGADRGDYYPITTGDPARSTATGDRTFQVRPTIQACDPRLPNSATGRGLQVGMADGSCRLLSPATSPYLFWGMVTPDRGECLPAE